jgi:hypothetical protein
MKGYRTIIFNAIMTALMILKVVNPEAELPTEGDVAGAVDATEAAIVSIWGVGNVILRAVTTTKIGSKE